jgi:hypothetical protein
MNRINIFLILIMVVSRLTAQENEPRFFSINYNQRIHFVNFQQFASIQEQALPKLNDNARFHGMTLEGAITDNIIISLYANGSLNDKQNNFGYTSWGGGLGVVKITYRYKLPSSFFTSIGTGLGCGRFSYSSALWDGTASITSDMDAIFLEPEINVGYIFKKKLVLIFNSSYMYSIAGNEYNVGLENLPKAFPNGWIIGASIGYEFSFINRK